MKLIGALAATVALAAETPIAQTMIYELEGAPFFSMTHPHGLCLIKIRPRLKSETYLPPSPRQREDLPLETAERERQTPPPCFAFSSSSSLSERACDPGDVSPPSRSCH